MMRLRALSLDLFGHFTDRRYDFGPASGNDFHIVYGPNEAGKTTTMEAALRLLYGFPSRDPYDFQHQRKNLRLSGVLEIDGQDHAFTRLPTRSASLLDGAGQPLPENALSAHLGGLGLDEYRSLLCLDDETIETGGENIANARGDIGRLLFSAAAGIADLNDVLDQARAEADALYRKRASTTRMAALKKELAEVERQIRDTDTPPAAWRKLKQALATAQTEEDAARHTRDALQSRKAEVATLRRVLPLLAERDTLDAALADCADAPARLDLDPDHLVALSKAQAGAEADRARLDTALAETQAALDGLTVNPAHLALTDRLDALDTLRSRHISETPDLPKRRRALDAALDDMARAARDLGVAAGTDPRTLVRSPAELSALDAARDHLRDSDRAAQGALAELTTLDTRLAEALRARDALVASAPPHAALADLLARHDADRLAPQHASVQASLTGARARVNEALAALTIAARRFDSLPDAPLDLSSAATLAQDHTTLTDQIARAHDDQTDAREAAERQSAQAEALTTGGPASDAQAHAARAERDALWQAHRATLTADSATAFEQAMARHDALADNRLGHASTLAQLREIARALADAQTRARQASDRLADLTDRHAAVLAQATAACAELGLPPLSPTALLDWLNRHAQASEAQRKLDALATEHAPVLARADALLDALRPLLSLEDPDLPAALDRARALVDDLRSHATRHASADQSVADLTRDRDARRRALDDRTAQADQARADWRALVQRIFDDTLSADTLESTLTPLRELREHDTHRVQAQKQITGMEADQQAFAAAVAGLADGMDLGDSNDPVAVFAALRSLANAATQAQTRQRDLTTRLTHLTEDRQKVDATLDSLALECARLAQMFPDATPDETPETLRARLDRARAVIDRRQRLADLDRALLSDLALPDLDAVRAALDGQTPAALEAETATLTADVARAETALTEATATRAHAQHDLSAITGDGTVAGLVEQRTTLELQIEQVARDYLERDFGLRLADEAIRRYRDSHRSGMMDATERAFAELTNGAYTRLLPRPEGNTEVLQVIDAQGTAKQVGDLSKGTRFQLYLALRAAAYEQLVAQGVVLPFFCDDIFETFDEDRTRAACRLMEHIGRSGQAIYLTHHRHVVDIAREVCSVPPRVHLVKE